MENRDEQLRSFYDAEMTERAARPLGPARERVVDEFREALVGEGRRSLLEVGCGAGRDGVRLSGSGIAYTGIDPSTTAVRICRERGLTALEASATALPFDDDSFDAAWSMSTLMHLRGEGLSRALAELGRVLRRGAPVAIGVWGSGETREWISPDGRFFFQRSDAELQRELGELGRVEVFETWDPVEDGGHYQWARVRV